jgi:hypothetical protein
MMTLLTGAANGQPRLLWVLTEQHVWCLDLFTGATTCLPPEVWLAAGGQVQAVREGKVS